MNYAKHVSALENFCSVIETAGGAYIRADGEIVGCVGDDCEWGALCGAYITACKALGREPKTEPVSSSEDDSHPLHMGFED